MKSINVKLNTIIADKRGILQSLLDEASKYKPLTSEQEKTATKEQLVNHNLLFACSVAFRHYTRKVDIMDLVSESFIGLMKAAESFDPNYGVRFISYAVNKMRAQVMHFIDMKGDAIRMSYTIQQNKLRKEFENEMLTDKELSDILGISEFTVKSIRNPLKFVSMDETNEDGDNVYQIAGDFQSDEDMMKSIDKELVDKLMRVLNEREREVIYLRYLDFFEHKRQEICKKYKISHEAVRLIEMSAINKMKKYYARISN
jgi:RNA polymerase sigma-32 factor